VTNRPKFYLLYIFTKYWSIKTTQAQAARHLQQH